MKLRLYSSLIVAIVLSASLNSTSADEMMQIVKSIKMRFSDYYAPKEWKAATFNWNLDTEINKLTDASSRGDADAFSHSLMGFFRATRDYHTSIRFADSSAAHLPISIKYIDGSFYIAYVAPSIAANFSLKVGDRVTQFNDDDVKELAYELMGKLDEPSLTDWSLAARKLTHRSAMALDRIDTGSVLIKAMRDDKPVFGQLVWDVSYGWNGPNRARSLTLKSLPSSAMAKLSSQQRLVIDNALKHIESRSFLSPLADVMPPQTEAASDPLALAKKESFLPALGDRIIWRSEPDNPWDAYIYLNKDNKMIGFIRIASYVPDASIGTPSFYAEKFGEILNKMNDITDALVIDQQNNPGGSVFYLYALASMLTDVPLSTPLHRFTIDSKDVFEAKQFLQTIDLLIAIVSSVQGPVGDVQGYPLDLQFLLHMKSYFQFMVAQWNQGKTLTDPSHLFGVNYIQPHPKYRYDKKILLLTNEMDFSGGDFFPAIMQDNHRVTMMGTTTAGAGGYVLSNADRNRAGIYSYNYTGSIAYRANGQPIENLGVTPDIIYQISPEDLTTGYAGFRAKINAALRSLL